jgi:hypothetical protein
MQLRAENKIPKKDDSFRLRSAVRAWDHRCCSQLPFANQSGRAALDTAFRSLVRAGVLASAPLGAASAAHHIDINIDVQKCFEHLDRSLLWEAGVAYGYPLYALRLSMRSYAWPRRILGQCDLAGSVVQATRGIAAGSARATSELMLYLLPVLVAAGLRAAHHSITHSVYVDDISMVCSSPSFEGQWTQRSPSTAAWY